MIEIFTDGSSRGNPGPGGYGVIMKFGRHQKEFSEGFRNTTNNRMELLSVIIGLKCLKSSQYSVVIYSDSKYVVDSVEKGWLWVWEKKDFKKKKNADLWRLFIPLHKKFKPKFKWVKGHAGHPENERCDELAVEAAFKKNLLIDEGFESGQFND